VAALVIGLVVVALVVGGGLLTGDDDDSDDEATGDRIDQGSAGDVTTSLASTTTVATTAPPPPPPPPAPPPPPPAEPLPGVTAQGAIDGLAGRGWTCAENVGLYPDHVVTDCDKVSAGTRAQVVANPAGEVVFVEVHGYEDQLGAFEEVASLGWTGVDGSAVATWIANTTSSATIMGSSDASFGEVTFSLVGDPASPVGNWALQFGQRPIP
jgi:hypothetical protein